MEKDHLKINYNSNKIGGASVGHMLRKEDVAVETINLDSNSQDIIGRGIKKTRKKKKQ